MQVKKSQQHWNTVSGPAIVYTYIYSMFEKLRSNATPTSLGLLPRQVPSGKACRAHCSWVCREHRLGHGSKCWLTNWWSWCPLESSSCVNEHQSKAANSQAKSHTCNQGNVLPPAEVSVFIFRLCHNQFLLPCDYVMCCKQPLLELSVWPWPAGRETMRWTVQNPNLCSIPWTFEDSGRTEASHKGNLSVVRMKWIPWSNSSICLWAFRVHIFHHTHCNISTGNTRNHTCQHIFSWVSLYF